MTTQHRPPIHQHRPQPRDWTPAERLGMAQRCSLSARETGVTLPTPPWAEEQNNDG